MSSPKYLTFSKHALEQIKHRSLSKNTIDETIKDPDNIHADSEGIVVYQKLVKEGDKHYLYRVFVNNLKRPPVVITAYKTSKTEKYENPLR